jgi:hypothetical protein
MICKVLSLPLCSRSNCRLSCLMEQRQHPSIQYGAWPRAALTKCLLNEFMNVFPHSKHTLY